MSFMLSHLTNGWQVDQAILSEEERVVVVRFGHDWDPTCMRMDEVLFKAAHKVKNFAIVYLVDVSEVPDFNKMYELYDPCTTMFFYRNKHIMIDLGTGNNNKINWAMQSVHEFVDIVETVYRGARKGRGLVVSPKDYSTKYRFMDLIVWKLSNIDERFGRNLSKLPLERLTHKTFNYSDESVFISTRHKFQTFVQKSPLSLVVEVQAVSSGPGIITINPEDLLKRPRQFGVDLECFLTC